MCTPSLCRPGENVLIIEESFPGETEEIVANEISLSSIHLAVQCFVSVNCHKKLTMELKYSDRVVC